MTKWNGENSVEIRHEQEERAAERREREQEAAEREAEEQAEADETATTCACGSTEFAKVEDMLVCRHCRRSWGPK